MEQLGRSIEELVAVGIRAYIGLIGLGERVRSRQVFSDALELSALMSGGPSSRIHPLFSCDAGGRNGGRLSACMMLLRLRSLLATLLVLRASRYWQRLPALQELQRCCAAVADLLDGDDALPGNGRACGRTAARLNGKTHAETRNVPGGRRNVTLPIFPELAEHSAADVQQAAPALPATAGPVGRRLADCSIIEQ